MHTISFRSHLETNGRLLLDPLWFLWMVGISWRLTNAPAAFQWFMNDIFMDMIDVIVIYIWMTFSSIPTHFWTQAHIRKYFVGCVANGTVCPCRQMQVHVTSCEYSDTCCLRRPHHGPYKSKSSKIGRTRKSKTFQSFLGSPTSIVVSFSDTLEITIPFMRLLQGYPWTSSMSATQPLKHLKGFTTALSLPIGFWTLNYSWDDASNYALPLSFQLWNQMVNCTIAIHSGLFLLWNSTMMSTKSLVIFEAFQIWRHYLKGLWTSDWQCHDHRNLQYF